jgi:carboxyl-terminal processing protease
MRTCERYAGEAGAAASRAAFIHVLERALGQLYDAHAHLGTNVADSPRLVPSQADVMAIWVDGKAVITDVRPTSAAKRAGIRAGDQVLEINGRSAAMASAEFEPRYVVRADRAARDWALVVALAGRHDKGLMKLKLQSPEGVREISYAPVFPQSSDLLSATESSGIGYIRIHNSLGDPSLVRAFDVALDGMSRATALVIDLRDTPSGGTSSVARGILGRFVEDARPYQRHELVSEERATGIRRIWVEYVAPRVQVFRGPVVVLVGRWTGSMGEGLAMGLNATAGAPVIGRPMAHLLGALGELKLPNSGIVVRVPVEKLFHVDGRPRESFLPCSVDERSGSSIDGDSELGAALDLAAKLVRTPSAAPACG